MEKCTIDHHSDFAKKLSQDQLEPDDSFRELKRNWREVSSNFDIRCKFSLKLAPPTRE